MPNTADIVAWSGELELLAASWSLDVGRVAEFRLAETTDEEAPHPFKQYTKRRGGKVGQRFHLTLATVDTQFIAYDEEVTFMGWSDSEKGRTCKLWLGEDSSLHPMAGYKKRTAKESGSSFMAVFVALHDDQQPEVRKEKKGNKLSSQAHLIVTNPRFCDYLQRHAEFKPQGGWTPELARRYVKHLLRIESLAELDCDEDVAEQFHTFIRKPFAAFNGDM